jgi:hypothetical protein
VRDFVGNKAAIDAVKATHSVVAISMTQPQPMDIEIDQTFRYPDTQRRIMKTPMGEITMVVSPSAAFMAGPMGTQDLPPSQRDAMKAESKFEFLTVLKSIDSPAYTFAASGTEKVGDANAQVLSITTDGTTVKWFIDPATGKLLRTSRQSRMGDQVTEYTAWKKSGDLNLPAAFSATTNGEKSASGESKLMEINPTIDAKLFEKPATK